MAAFEFDTKLARALFDEEPDQELYGANGWHGLYRDCATILTCDGSGRVTSMEFDTLGIALYTWRAFEQIADQEEGK